MKLVFVHDTKFWTGSDGTVFTASNLPYSVIQRYLQGFTQVTVVGFHRLERIPSSVSRLARADGPGVRFELLPDRSGMYSLAWIRDSCRALEPVIVDSDVVLIRLPSRLGFLVANIAMRRRLPYAVEVVGDAWNAYWFHGSPLGKLFAPIAEYYTRKAVRRASLAVYVTTKYLQSRYPTGGRTISLSDVQVSVPPWEFIQESRWKRDLSKSVTLGLIGFVNARYKGIETALRALAHVSDHLPSFEFRILGDGDPLLWQRCVASLGLQGKVHFDGTLPSGQPVLDWLDGIDVYVQPSLTEGLPRAVIEAMSRGCPVLASNVGGIPELLDKSALHAPGDYRGLAELILRAVKDHEWRRSQSRRNWERAKDFDRIIIENRWRQVVDLLLGLQSLRE